MSLGLMIVFGVCHSILQACSGTNCDLLLGKIDLDLYHSVVFLYFFHINLNGDESFGFLPILIMISPTDMK